MAKGRILFVNQEVAPFTAETPQSLLGKQLPSKLQEMGREIRVFMPKYSNVSDRRHQLHEVIRLSGMNLIVNNCDHQLIIKVGSVPTARMQVYFIDNEEYFMHRGGVMEADGTMGDDIDERILFFGRGTLEAVRKLAWQPHLINFSGWFTAMIPFYLRRLNKENEFFKGTKLVITLTGNEYEGVLNGDLTRKMKADQATAKDLRLYADTSYKGLMKAAISFSQGVIVGAPNVDPELIEFAKESKKNLVEYVDDRAEFFANTNKMFETVMGKIN
ncbi:MAG: glycogen/starch synthase [Bacteroidales bacterium]|nr:glycogen/starch synthase [Bacteroidales bacterium]